MDDLVHKRSFEQVDFDSVGIRQGVGDGLSLVGPANGDDSKMKVVGLLTSAGSDLPDDVEAIPGVINDNERGLKQAKIVEENTDGRVAVDEDGIIEFGEQPTLSASG